jgi:NADPH-dependent ferric siderophore reductase
MASGKGLLLDSIGRFFLTEATVTSVEPLGERFLSVALSGTALRGADWTPGDKIQVLLPGRDVRTFTPVRWDAGGTTELLLYLHGGATPATRWARAVAAGDAVRFIGPQRSVRVPDGRPVVLYGDETSFGVACALAGSRPAGALGCVFEVSSRADVGPVLERLGFDAAATERAGSAHLGTIADRLRSELAARPGAALVMTGCASSIQAVRALLRAGGPRPEATKAYWAPGKAGLD